MKNFFAFVICASVLGGWFLYHKMNEMRESLTEGRAQLEGLEKMVSDREREFNTIVRALDLQQQAGEKQKELQGILAHQQAVEQEIASLKRQQQKQVSVNRQGLIGTVLTNLKLVDGRTFTEARVSKIDDTSVSLTVPSGIIKVKPADLPPEIRQILQYQ